MLLKLTRVPVACSFLSLAGLLCVAVLAAHPAAAQNATLGTCTHPINIPGVHAGDSRYNATVVVGEGVSTCTHNGSVTYHLTAVDAARVLVVSRCLTQPQQTNSTQLWKSRLLIYPPNPTTCDDPNTWQTAIFYSGARNPLAVQGIACAGQPGFPVLVPANSDFFITVEGISSSNCGPAALNITEVVTDQWGATGSCLLPLPALYLPPPGTSSALTLSQLNPCTCTRSCVWPAFNRSVASIRTAPPVAFDGVTTYGLDVCGYGKAPTWNMQLAVFAVQPDMCSLSYDDLINPDNGLLLNMKTFGPNVVCGTGSAYLMFRPPAGSQIQIAVMSAGASDCGPLNLMLQGFGPTETLPGPAPEYKGPAPHPPAPPLLAQHGASNKTTAVAAGVAVGCAAVLAVALLVWAKLTGRLSSCGASSKGAAKTDMPATRHHSELLKASTTSDNSARAGARGYMSGPAEEVPLAVVVVDCGDGLGAKQPQLLAAETEAPGSGSGSIAAAQQQALVSGSPLQSQDSQRGDDSGRQGLPLAGSSSPRVRKPPAILGLDKDDPFMRSTARHLRWAATAPEGAWALEEGVTWHSAGSGSGSSSSSSSTPDNAASNDVGGVQQLTAAQVANELELFADGLIDKGSTALVFRCRWPRRFGPTALLAAKVLRDSYDPDSRNTAAFHHEARVLAACAHPNVVRMYGCCLEKPALVLVLELLPGSLKHRLYGHKLLQLQYAASQCLPAVSETSNPASSLPSAAVTSQASSAGTAALTEQRSTQPSTCTSGSAGASCKADTSTAQEGPVSSEGPTSSPHVSAQLNSLASPTSGAGGSAASSMQAGLLSIQSAQELSPAASSALLTPSPGPSSSLKCGEHSLLHSSIPEALPFTAPAPPPPPPPITVTEAMQLMADVAAGLSYLHQQDVPGSNDATAAATKAKVVHRDLKPANILINSQGRAKISDFGLARTHQDTSFRTEQVGAGTLGYMAPEVLGCVRAERLTNKVDMYSLGIIMWEVAAQEPPWKGMLELQIPIAVTSGIRPPLPAHPLAPPPSLASVSSSPLTSQSSWVSYPSTARTAGSLLSTSSSVEPSTSLMQKRVSPSADGGYMPAFVRSPSNSGISDTSAAGADKPAAFSAMPLQYTTLIKACWQQNERRRPTAAGVQKVLVQLLKQQQQ